MTQNSLLMQSKLGRIHDLVKEFGSRGTPLRECFWKKVRTDRVKLHVDFLFDERHKDEINATLKKLMLTEHYKNQLKKLRERGYQVM